MNHWSENKFYIWSNLKSKFLVLFITFYDICLHPSLTSVHWLFGEVGTDFNIYLFNLFQISLIAERIVFLAKFCNQGIVSKPKCIYLNVLFFYNWLWLSHKSFHIYWSWYIPFINWTKAGDKKPCSKNKNFIQISAILNTV